MYPERVGGPGRVSGGVVWGILVVVFTIIPARRPLSSTKVWATKFNYDNPFPYIQLRYQV
jgi:hypothetical protein